MEFEWDEEKAAANLAKHGISCEEARTVFDNPLYVNFYDPDHSSEEHRHISSGSLGMGVCCLCHTQSEAI